MGGKTSTASKRKFNDKTYQRIVLDVRMDAFPNKEAVQVAAQKAGQSLTEYIMEAVRLRMEQENSASGTPGVVKNLEGDADPLEWDSCSISPDLIKIQQQKASAFHRNVIGRGLFALRKWHLKNKKVSSTVKMKDRG